MNLKAILAILLYLVVMFALIRRHLKIKKGMKRIEKSEEELNKRTRE
ncbi:MAG: hypothetical protein K9H64_02880 [Bacteroidales bacterium]|nr:hypothetical protein [Bacteroidales bacterium]MCF8454816.1 hypothetical protein [Bacteroidales bacterium]